MTRKKPGAVKPVKIVKAWSGLIDGQIDPDRSLWSTAAIARKFYGTPIRVLIVPATPENCKKLEVK